MNILIIEDEIPASDRLAALVKRYDPLIRILGTLRSVKESVHWLQHHPPPDLILADIQLNDGLSLHIFNQHPVASPLIFTTAFDEYLLKAFEFNSIDYLLKPVDKEKLFRALRKYESLKQHFSTNILPLLEQIQKGTPVKDRIVVKKGTDFVTVKTDQTAYFLSEFKMTFLVDRSGKRYIVDQTLAELAEMLEQQQFFRINRKYLVHIDSIHRFRPHDHGKILVELTPSASEEIVVSQENAPVFRKWIGK